MKRNKSVLPLCITAIMAAMYFVLAHFLTFRAGNLHISFASLPIALLAAFFGPVESCLAAFLGELLNQMLSYGFTVTTPLWLLPPVFRALLLSCGFSFIRKQHDKDPWKSPFAHCIVILVSAVFTTLLNTAVIWFDSLIGHYYSSVYVFGDFFLRLIAGVLTAVVVGLVSIPVLSTLSSAHFPGINDLRKGKVHHESKQSEEDTQ